MSPNLIASSDDVMAALAVQAIVDVVDESGDDVTTELLTAGALKRYAELTAPFVNGIGNYFAETIDTTLREVACKSAFTAGAEPFSIEAVIDASMEKLEKTIGAPNDREMAREAIRDYLDEVHGTGEGAGR